MFSEGSGFDYRMWHLPLCLSCMNQIATVTDPFFLNAQITIHLYISPYSQKEEEPAREVREIKVSSSSRTSASCSPDFQPA